jgi:hypothetical protein
MKTILLFVMASLLVLSLNSFLAAQFLDTDGDGIADNVEANPDCTYVPSGLLFTDYRLGGKTYGLLDDYGDQSLQIEDVLPDAIGDRGVQVSAASIGGPAPATIVLYTQPWSYFYFTPGDVAVLTCGSVSVEVIAGILTMILTAEDGSEATVELSENNSLTFEPFNAIFYVPATNTEDVVVFIDNTEVTIVPGQSVYVDDGVVGEAISIDIKPGSDDNCINSDGHGIIPVAILGSPTLDVTHIDPASVQLEGLSVKIAGKNNKLLTYFEDVNNDEYTDLVVQIEDTDLTFAEGTTKATLSCYLENGALLKGVDNIRIVPPVLPKPAIEINEPTISLGFRLNPIAPNPFNPAATISYTVAKSSHVKLTVYNTLGQVVAVLVDGFQPSGSYSVTWNASNEPSGLYLCRFEAEDFTATKKMFLQK